MRNIIIVIIGIFLLSVVYADPWVDDFNNCPDNYAAQNCLVEGELVCGYSAPTLECSDPSEISAPATIGVTYSDNNNASFDGGYIINCIDYDSGDPFCDNEEDFWCERNESCHGSPMYRNTNCTASVFGESTCGNCKTEGTNYYNCYGDINCESTSTSDCENSNNNHYITATCDDQTAGGTCECDTDYFACDGSITDADGCEWHDGDLCFSSTGTIQDDECFSASQGNCTRRFDYLDCNNDDSDSNELTCNSGDGCEIDPGFTDCTGGANNNYVDCSTCQCDTNYLDCDSGGVNATNGCEINDNGVCGNSTGTYDGCAGGTGNCTATGSNQDCDDDDSDNNLDTCNGANGCEVDTSGSCTVGILQGSYNGDCTCDVDPQHHLTNQSAGGSSDHANLWSDQYGSSSTSWLFNFTQHNFNAWVRGDHLGNINASGNVTLAGGYICDLIACYNITVLNATGGTGDNSSWNQSHANTLFLNRTSESLYTTTYNATYDALVTDNSSWNQSHANTLYAGIGDVVNITSSFGGEVSGTYDNIVLGHDALDDQYYDSEGDLTGLLDNNYAALGGDEEVTLHWDNVTDKPANLDTDSTDDVTIGSGNLTYVDWSNLTNVPAGLDDGDDVGSGGAGMFTDEGDYIQPNSSYADNVNIDGYLNVSNGDLTMNNSQLNIINGVDETAINIRANQSDGVVRVVFWEDPIDTAGTARLGQLSLHGNSTPTSDNEFAFYTTNAAGTMTNRFKLLADIDNTPLLFLDETGIAVNSGNKLLLGTSFTKSNGTTIDAQTVSIQGQLEVTQGIVGAVGSSYVNISEIGLRINALQTNSDTNLEFWNEDTSSFNTLKLDKFGFVGPGNSGFVLDEDLYIQGQVLADDWSNVSITTDQVSNYSDVDTNETAFILNLSSANCSGTDKVIGVYENGTVACGSDDVGSGGAGKSGGTPWLYNDSTTIYFNDTYGNNTYGFAIYYNKTATIYNGSLSYNGLVGYAAGHAICNASFEGTHMCNAFEIIDTKRFKNTSAMDTWDTNPATCYAHIIAGGPKYAPATTPFNDCDGFTSDSATRGGNFFEFCNEFIAAGTCEPPNEKSLACCKVW